MDVVILVAVVTVPKICFKKAVMTFLIFGHCDLVGCCDCCRNSFKRGKHKVAGGCCDRVGNEVAILRCGRCDHCKNLLK